MKVFFSQLFAIASQILPSRIKNFIFKFNGKTITRYLANRKKLGKSIHDEIFTMNNGDHLSVERGYRWSIKQGWMYYPELLAFKKLLDRKLLLGKDIDFLQQSIGENTLNISSREISNYFQSRRDNYSDYLLSNNENDPILICPLKKESEKRIGLFLKRYKDLFFELKQKNLYNISRGDNLLEIGYESGGHSMFALEKLGFNVTGIDNGYSGLRNISTLPESIKESIGSSVKFTIGDITKNTSVISNSMTVINTIAVLEHIMDLPAAFKEMYRILKPGGVMIHSYDPYFHPAGGHGLGVLDTRWGHLQLNPEEYKRYLNQYRPNEFQESVDWYQNGIHRSYPERLMMQLLGVSGFEILYWNSKFINQSEINCISDKILVNIFRNYPEISMNDLLISEQTFVARKI